MESQENVLLLPWLFGLEADNPMASEMSSHIGMKGTMYCRICEARGKDVSTRGSSKEAEIAYRTEFMKVCSYM